MGNLGEKFMDWLMVSFWRFFTVIFIFCFLLAGFFTYMSSLEPHFTLRKSEWECVEDHIETRIRPVVVGKMVTSQSTRVTVCDGYKRIKQ